MRGEWRLRDWESEFWRGQIENVITKFNYGIIKEFNLTEQNICPENVIDVLKLLGYEYENVYDNGWEQDTWIEFTHTKTQHKLTLFYCGRTFEMKLYPGGEKK